MFRLSKISFFAAAVLLPFACSPGKIDPEPGPEPEPWPEPEDVRSITVGAESISAVGAVMKGKAEINTESGSVMFGFQYCTLDGSTTSPVLTVLSNDVDKNYNYSASLSSLEPNTTYKYWSFVRYGGKDSYGEPKEFKTRAGESMLSTLDASGSAVDGIILNARLDLTDVQYKEISYGFHYGSSASSLNLHSPGSEIVNNAYSAQLGTISYNTKYWYRAYLRLDGRFFYGEIKNFTTEEFKITAVDLGLGVKWANANLGADYPEDYGDFYAYGAIKPQSGAGYDWDSYRWANGDWKTLIKYCPSDKAEYWDAYAGEPDNKTVLDAEDDAARAVLGEGWRMPSYDDMKELYTNCSWEWIRGSGGCRVTGPNGNSIFLPAAGCMSQGLQSGVGTRGDYLSSSINVELPASARYVYFQADSRDIEGDNSRCNGFSIRAVTD